MRRKCSIRPSKFRKLCFKIHSINRMFCSSTTVFEQLKGHIRDTNNGSHMTAAILNVNILECLFNFSLVAFSQPEWVSEICFFHQLPRWYHYSCYSSGHIYRAVYKNMSVFLLFDFYFIWHKAQLIELQLKECLLQTVWHNKGNLFPQTDWSLETWYFLLQLKTMKLWGLVWTWFLGNHHPLNLSFTIA